MRYLPVFDNKRAVYNVFQKIQAVLADDNRFTSRLQFAQNLRNLFDIKHIQIGSRLVEQNKLGIGCEGRRNCNHLFFAA